jgi:hypothetical protein
MAQKSLLSLPKFRRHIRRNLPLRYINFLLEHHSTRSRPILGLRNKLMPDTCFPWVTDSCSHGPGINQWGFVIVSAKACRWASPACSQDISLKPILMLLSCLLHILEVSHQRLVILTEVFRSFPQSLQASSWIFSFRPQPLPSTSFPIHYLLITLALDTI